MEDAVARWDTVIARWPQDPVAYDEAAFTILFFLSDPGAARPYLEKAVELGMLGPSRTVDALVALGRLDDALAAARQWAAESPGVHSTSQLSVVHRLRGDRDAALAAAREVLSAGWLPGLALPGRRCSERAFWSFVEADALDEVEAAFAAQGLRAWDALALQGRLREATRTFDEDSPSGNSWARARDAPIAARALFHNLRASLVWGSGDAGAVWREAEEMFRLGSSAAACSAHMLASLGDLDRGARLAALWSGFGDPRMYCSQLYRHVRDWKEGRLDDAARGLAAMYGPEPAFWLGVVLRDLGRDREAIEAFRRFRRDPSWNTGPFSLTAHPRSLFYEAELLERLGDEPEALRVSSRLARLWRRADGDLPLVAEARALHERLAARSRSTDR
jgi:tetratricopeptide (TPR) repeat protein